MYCTNIIKVGESGGWGRKVLTGNEVGFNLRFRAVPNGDSGGHHTKRKSDRKRYYIIDKSTRRACSGDCFEPKVRAITPTSAAFGSGFARYISPQKKIR